MMQHRQVRYIGLDVHKVSISVAIAEAERFHPIDNSFHIRSSADCVLCVNRLVGRTSIDRLA